MEGNTELQKSINGELKPQSQIVERSGVNGINGLKIGFSRMLKEIGIGSPRTKLVFFNRLHRSAEDMDGLEDEFQKCDIYFHETFGWKPEFLNALQELSNGNVTPEMALQVWGDTNNPHFYSRDGELFKIIYNSKKPIAILDVPESHPLVKREKENKVPSINFGSNFDQVLDSVRGYIENAADIQKERETYMVEQLKPQIQELLKTHPELRKKKEINILVSIGVAHTSLSRRLRKDYQTTIRSGRTPMTFSYTSEAMRRHMFNKPVDDELVARIVTEWTLSKAHKKVFHTSDSLKDAVAMRKLVSRFSLDEMKNMFEGAHNLNEWANSFLQRSRKKQVAAAVKN